MEDTAPLTNKERRENVAFLLERYRADPRQPTPLLDDDELTAFRADADERQRLFYKLLCYAALTAQPAPEAIVRADWERFSAAGVVDALYARTFDLATYSVDPPVTRGDSKGKLVDFSCLAQHRDVWSQLLPEPADPEATVDVLRATSGGALKSRAFWVVREMRRNGLWSNTELDRYGYVPDGRVRKRSVRMGLIDLPEKADTFADMKTASRALHAVMRLAEKQNGSFDLPVSMAAERCEICDALRMATCPMPHCRFRRQAAAAA